MVKIVFFGSFGQFSKMYLEALKKAGFDVVLAIEDKNTDFNNIEKEMLKIKPDLGVIAYFGKIISKKILGIPKKDFINAHPSLLPRWRGPSPIQNTILADDKKTGITIHLTSKEVDAGDILAQKEIPVSSDDTCFTLTEKLAREGSAFLPNVIEKYISGSIKPKPQNHSLATYTKLIKKEDGLIDWSKPPEYIERLVRAYDPWPGTYIKIINSKSQILNKFKILKIKKVKLEDGKLKILIVQPEGKKDMPYEAFLRGHKDFSSPI